MNDSLTATVLIALLGGALRVSTPFMFVALGECLTEKSGRVNLGLEGTLVLGAVSAYATSYHSGSPWLGVFAAGCAGASLGAIHGFVCKLPRVNDIAIGIAMMLLGTGVAFFFGKAYIQPTAPRLESISLGDWTGNPKLATALQINPLLIVGVVTAFVLWWAFANTRWGLLVRMSGDSAPAARAHRRLLGRATAPRVAPAARAEHRAASTACSFSCAPRPPRAVPRRSATVSRMSTSVLRSK
jgi:simple sugar transport system permease protein